MVLVFHCCQGKQTKLKIVKDIKHDLCLIQLYTLKTGFCNYIFYMLKIKFLSDKILMGWLGEVFLVIEKLNLDFLVLLRTIMCPVIEQTFGL